MTTPSGLTVSPRLFVRRSLSSTSRGTPVCLAVALAFAFAALPVGAGTYTVSNLLDDGDGSLRWAIGQANTHAGADTIQFSVLGTISPASALPELTDDGTVIDASSQWQGAWPAGEPGVRLDGTNAGTGVSGIVISGADNCRVSGLVVANFKNHGVQIKGYVYDNIVGGGAAGCRNVLSGNGSAGLRLEDIGPTGSVVSGNYIGLTPTGAAWGNQSSGIYVSSASGPNEIRGNVIAANGGAGITLFGDQQTIAGNIIGMDPTAEVAMGNSEEGIMTYYSDNVIGGPDAADGNVIAHNGEYGISFGSSSDDNWIEGNWIHHNADSGIRTYGQHNTVTRCTFEANGTVGIELRLDGNEGLGAPAPTDATLTAGLLHIQGTGAGAGNTVEVFVADSPTSGQGKVYLGALVADAAGAFSGDLDVAGIGVFGGQHVTATTTDASGNTSEFSAVQLIESDGTKISASSGAWSEPPTWMGGVVPGATDNVVIREGHSVAVGDGMSCQDLRLLPDARLELSGAMPAATGTVDFAPGTVAYVGTVADQTVLSALAYGGLELGGSAAKTIDGSLTVGGNLALSGTTAVVAQGGMEIGGNLTVGGQTSLTLGGDVDVAGRVSVGLDATLVGGTHVLAVGGSWSTPGTWECGTSHVVFAGIAAQEIGPAPGAGGDTQVGEQGNSVDGDYPFDNYNENGRSQLLYLGAAIGTSGSLSALQFQLSQVPPEASDRQLEDFQIRMRQTDDTNWSGRSDFVDMADSVLVFSAAPYTMPDATGWFEIELDTPFAYDSSSNLVIDIRWGPNADWVFSSERFEVLGTNQAYTGVLYGRSDYETPPDYDGRSSLLPNAVFTFLAGGTAPEFHHLTIDNANAPVTSQADLPVHGDLAVTQGSELAMGVNVLTVAGTTTLAGPVSYATSADVADGVASSFPAGGMDLLTMMGEGVAPGTTEVTACTGIACPANAFGSGCRAAPDTVLRYFDISPATAVASTVRFHYLESERNGLAHGAELHPFHWSGADGRWEEAGTYAGHGGSGTVADPYYVEYAGIDSFSPFVLANGSPDGGVNAPSGLTATATSPSSVNLHWQDNTVDETAFRIERSDDGGDWQLLATVAAGTVFYTDATAIEGIGYAYRVQAVRGEDLSAYSNEVDVAMPLLPPVSLVATATGPGTMDLAWTVQSTHENAYEVERKVAGGGYTLVATLVAGSAAHADSGLSERTTYTYRVRAASDVSDSAYSNEATATTQLAAPTGLAASAAAGQIALSWNDNSTAETGYLIERRQVGGVFAALHTTGAGATSWTDSEISSGVAYEYRVAAIDADGQSGYSATVKGMAREPRAFFVRPDGTGDGSDWSAAMDLLDAVLAANVDGDIVHVGEGTYRGAFVIAGAVQLLGGYPDTLVGTDTTGRSPADYGTTIDAEGTGMRVLTLRGNATVDGFTLTNGDGGIYCQQASPIIQACKIASNSATSWHGGGIRVEGGAPAILYSEITANTTDYNGGGIWFMGSSPRIEGNEITWNEAPEGSGGGIFSQNPSCSNDAAVTGNQITNNLAARGGAGVGGSGNWELNGNDVSSNAGDGVVSLSSSLVVEDCTITGNTGVGISGGGTFRSNTISANGGRGVVVDTAVVDGNLISLNQGGGLAVGDGACSFSSVGRIINNIIVGNHAESCGGGVKVWYADGEVDVANNTIVGNTSDDGYHGVWVGCFGGSTYTGYRLLVEGFELTFRNCIICGNGDARSDLDLYIWASGWYSDEAVQLKHCNVATISKFEQSAPDDYVGDEPAVYVLTGCINADSGFLGDDDYHLAADSPCINKGTAENAPDHDYDGDSRPWDGGVDIGADEAAKRVHNVTVDTWHPTIQEALQFAGDYHTIEVYPGTYAGNLTISAPVYLSSTGGCESTVIEASDTASPVVEVRSQGVSLAGFTIQSATGPGAAGVAVVGPDVDMVSIDECRLMSNTIGLLVDGGAVRTKLTASIVAHNNEDGIRLTSAVSSMIGGDEEADGNFIYDNGGHGVRIEGDSTTQSVLCHNRIGIQTDGTAAGNAGAGVCLQGGTTHNSVGEAGKGNVISANAGAGVAIQGEGTKSNSLQSNVVGLDTDGTIAIANGGGGVDLRDMAELNQIGGIGSGNTISGNTGFNLRLTGTATQGNVVWGNLIGPDVGGDSVPAGGNPACGILVEAEASSNEIGGDAAGKANTISGHGECGVRITGSGTTGNRLRSNRVGTNETGRSALPNGQYGVELCGGASTNVIGEGSLGNTISGNVVAGVHVAGAGTTGNSVMGNCIGPATGGLASLLGDTQAQGVVIEGGAQGSRVGSNLISGNTADGVFIGGESTASNYVGGNLIGTDKNGTVSMGNGQHGIHVSGAAHDNRIGAMLDDERSVVVSGNRVCSSTLDGIFVEGTGTTGNQIVGNEIGGVVGMRNGRHGISIVGGASGNTIGGGDAEERNVVSGNTECGIRIEGARTDNNTVRGNLIGCNSSGDAALANGEHGVWIKGGAQGNAVGGTGSGMANAVSGNEASGIVISGAGTSGNSVLGNLIGTKTTGLAALPNGGNGILVSGSATANVIGSTATAGANVIAGNTASGVRIEGAGTAGNQVIGNRVGVSTANKTVANGSYGVLLTGAATGNTIGGQRAEGAGNVISGNAVAGVRIEGEGTDSNAVRGNLVGPDSTGLSTPTGDGQPIGVHIVGAAAQNLIGSQAGAGNTISGNTACGIRVEGVGTEWNEIAGNRVGTVPDGSADLPNGGPGIAVLDGASGTKIGTAALGNLVSGNDEEGILVGSAPVTEMLGNMIGLDADGLSRLGNAGDGVSVADSADVVIRGNTIAANGGNGIALEGAGGTDAEVSGNFVGTNGLASTGLGNALVGVSISQGATDSTVGPDNVIAASGQQGVLIAGEATTGHVLTRNSIHGNAGDGIALQDGGNQEVPSPVLTGVEVVAGTLRVVGTLPYSVDNVIEIFAADSAGSGEGQTFLGVATGAADNTFELIVETDEVGVGDPVTATARYVDGDTSAFGAVALATEFVPPETTVLTWPDPAAIVYGTALGDGQLAATANTTGEFRYTPAAGTVLDAGVGQELRVQFVPDDPFTWTTETATVTIDVNPAALTCAAADKAKVVGCTNPPLIITYVGLANGDVAPATPPTVSCGADETSGAGTYPICLSGGADPNYDMTLHDGELTVVEGETLCLWADNGEGRCSVLLQFGEADIEDGFAALNEAASVAEVAYLLDPEENCLLRDFRPVAETTRWRVVVPDDYTRGTVTLTWDVAPAAAANREVYLQELCDEEAVGFPIDMRAVATAEFAAGSEFEVVYSVPSEITLSLAAGWNLTGNPIMSVQSAADIVDGSVRDDVEASTLWWWRGTRYSVCRRDEPLTPERGHWVHCGGAGDTVPITGILADGVTVLLPGWNLVSPAASCEAPAGIAGTIWRWDTVLQTYVLVEGRATLEAGQGYWLYNDTGEPLTVDLGE